MRTTACFFLPALMLCAVHAPATAPSLQSHERDLGALEQRIDELGTTLGAQRQERRVLIEELEQREREVAERALAERALEQQRARQQQASETLAERQREQKQELELELARLAELMREAYVMGGRADRLRALLDQDDPARISRLLSYFAYLNRERLQRIEAVQRGAITLARLRREIEQQAAELARVLAEQRQALAELEAARAQRAEVLAALEADIASRSQNLRQLETDAEALRLLVEHLRQRAAIQAELGIRRESFAARKGHLAWPLLEGQILTRFGTRKAGSELRWDGVLLAAREGEEVRAVHDGRVVYANWLRGFGLLLVLDHGEGYLSLYGHNEALTRELGEWVATGDVIALGGRSGGQTRPALYFAIRRHGKPQDPRHWCGSTRSRGHSQRAPVAPPVEAAQNMRS